MNAESMVTSAPSLRPMELRIRETCEALSCSKTKGALGECIACEIIRFSLIDLQIIGGRLHRELENVPSPYREALRPHLIGQIFGMHHTVLAMHNSGAFKTMREPLTDPATFGEFCRMVPEGCYSWDGGIRPDNPVHRLFYYLVSACAMFVFDQPGHPLGMPFPGGFRVEKTGGIYLCPVRDREKEVFFSICNFCPAKQSDVP